MTVNRIPVYQFETVVVNPATKRDKSITDDFTKFRCRGTSGAKITHMCVTCSRHPEHNCEHDCHAVALLACVLV